MAWALAGEITVGPNDIAVPIADVTLGPGEDTLWVRASQLSGPNPWEFSYGLLSWVTPEGREFGTVKCFPEMDGEVLRLGLGLAPEERTGELVFESRLWNRRWLSSTATTLRMRFEVKTGTGGGGGASQISGSFVSAGGVGLELARVVFP